MFSGCESWVYSVWAGEQDTPEEQFVSKRVTAASGAWCRWAAAGVCMWTGSEGAGLVEYLLQVGSRCSSVAVSFVPAAGWRCFSPLQVSLTSQFSSWSGYSLTWVTGSAFKLFPCGSGRGPLRHVSWNELIQQQVSQSSLRGKGRTARCFPSDLCCCCCWVCVLLLLSLCVVRAVLSAWERVSGVTCRKLSCCFCCFSARCVPETRSRLMWGREAVIEPVCCSGTGFLLPGLDCCVRACVHVCMCACVRTCVCVSHSLTPGCQECIQCPVCPGDRSLQRCVCVCVCVCVWLGPSVAMVTVTGIRPDAGLVQIVEESVQCFSTWCVI